MYGRAETAARFANSAPDSICGRDRINQPTSHGSCIIASAASNFISYDTDPISLDFLLLFDQDN